MSQTQGWETRSTPNLCLPCPHLLTTCLGNWIIKTSNHAHTVSNLGWILQFWVAQGLWGAPSRDFLGLFINSRYNTSNTIRNSLSLTLQFSDSHPWSKLIRFTTSKTRGLSPRIITTCSIKGNPSQWGNRLYSSTTSCRNHLAWFMKICRPIR